MEKSSERRRFFRTDVDLPATFFLQAQDYLRRPCRIFNLSGSGCAVKFPHPDTVSAEETHQIAFELPNRNMPLEFECALVGSEENEEGGQNLRLHYLRPRAGDQDAVVTYVLNRKRYEVSAYRVAIPVSIEAQGGVRQFIPYKGQTVEVGKDYAICELERLGLPASSQAVATFQAPHFRDEVFFQSTISRVERNMRGGYTVRLQFEDAADRMLEFVRHHYGDKAKSVQATVSR